VVLAFAGSAFEVAAKIAQLDAFEAELRRVNEQKVDTPAGLAAHRGTMRKSLQFRTLLTDSPAIDKELRELRTRIKATWLHAVAGERLDSQSINVLGEDLDLLGISPPITNTVQRQLQLLTADSPLIAAEPTRSQLLDSLQDTIAGRGEVDDIRRMVRNRILRRTANELRAVDQSAVTYEILESAEQLIRVAPDLAADARPAVAALHAARAARFAGTGRAAVLSLAHLERAKDLGLATDSGFATLKATAEASLTSAGPLSLRVLITTNANDEPIVQDITRLAVLQAIRAASREHTVIRPLGIYEKEFDIRVAIESAQAIVPKLADLSTVSSSFLSHYEDIPNPVKESLNTQLAFQQITVDSALSSLNSAIASHNIYPTQYSLINVNGARSRYAMAINTYNLLVQQYNLTNSTISRPVYLPYVFREGTVRHGWRVSGVITIASASDRFSVEVVDTDFVRFGTRADDRDSSRRRDDGVDIRVGADRLVEQLLKAAESIRDDIAKAAVNLPVSIVPDLAPEERDIVSRALYPFRAARSARPVRPWAERALAALTVPAMKSRPSPPNVRLTAPPNRPTGATPEKIAAHYAGAVALVLAKENRGSGALVSHDGLVITAAHVVRSDDVEVAFPGTGSDKRHRATVVFLDETNDVALLRVNDHRATTWFELALSESPSAGEPIAALGNPAIGQSGSAVGAISVGIVAKPYAHSSDDGLPGVVADITVASGSSGGPLISQRSGKVIGVVTAIVPPGVSKEFSSSSGYWTIAAPASELHRWLGLTYGP
jgi:hypothetical protein